MTMCAAVHWTAAAALSYFTVASVLVAWLGIVLARTSESGGSIVLRTSR